MSLHTVSLYDQSRYIELWYSLDTESPYSESWYWQWAPRASNLRLLGLGSW